MIGMQENKVRRVPLMEAVKMVSFYCVWVSLSYLIFMSWLDERRSGSHPQSRL
jgi:hypothetical protein